MERGRDSSRLTDIDSLMKSNNLFYSEREDFPGVTADGCVNQAALANYG
jgi:hypothetical protein